MTFSVVWSLFALQTVTRLEQLADDPKRILVAQDRIDWALRRTPRDMGESRDPNFRIWYEDVLGVYYRIDENALRVEVLYAGPARRR
ncbi:MAG: hypothetical protein K8U57_17365 [Planctomycetes bacterium]|nr:hypothetical protein [Planctomycetota bacterium]